MQVKGPKREDVIKMLQTLVGVVSRDSSQECKHGLAEWPPSRAKAILWHTTLKISNCYSMIYGKVIVLLVLPLMFVDRSILWSMSELCKI